MLKKLNVLFIVAILMLSNNVFCQDDYLDCDPTCLPQSPWTLRQQEIKNIPACPMYKIVAWYWDRWNSCTNKYEVKLSDFAWYSRTCESCTDCQECLQNNQFWNNNLSWWVLNQIVVDNTFTRNQLEGHPHPPFPYCIEINEAALSRCYKFEWVNSGPLGPGGYWHTVRCNQTCCIFTFRVCFDANGNPTQFPPEIIDYVVPPPVECDPDCMTFCNGPEPRIGIYGDKKDNDMDGLNVTTDLLGCDVKINLQNNIKGDYKIIIYDINGKEIMVQNKLITSVNTDWVISFINFKSGNYLYEIILDNKIVKSGKIFVMK